MIHPFAPRLRLTGLAATLAFAAAGAVWAEGQAAQTEAPEAEVAAVALPEGATIWDGVFTAEQAEAGRDIFMANCEGCHGPTARGGPGAPGIVGRTLDRKYVDQPLSNYFGYMSANMPPGRVGAITPDAFTQVVSFLLTLQGAEPGDIQLSPELMDQITIVRRPE